MSNKSKKGQVWRTISDWLVEVICFPIHVLIVFGLTFVESYIWVRALWKRVRTLRPGDESLNRAEAPPIVRFLPKQPYYGRSKPKRTDDHKECG